MKRSAVKTPESVVLRACMQYLTLKGIFHWRNNTGAVKMGKGRWVSFGLKGSSDIIGLLPDGRFLAVECKAERGRLSPEQRAFLDRVNATHGLALVARSWEDIDAALRKEGYVNDGPLFSPKRRISSDKLVDSYNKVLQDVAKTLNEFIATLKQVGESNVHLRILLAVLIDEMAKKLEEL
jgi:hypothetical protein